MRLDLNKKNYIKLLTSLFVVIVLLISLTLFVSYSLSETFKDNANNGTEVSIAYGDVNLDGEITTMDYQQIKSYFLGNYDISEQIKRKSADVNNDGFINEIDTELVRLFVLGTNEYLLDNTLPTKPIKDYLQLGDVNNDGAVNNKDVLLLYNYLNRSEKLMNIQLLNADVNQDGIINDKDLVILFKYISTIDGFDLPYTEENIPNNVISYGDINEDGSINNKDLVLLYRHINEIHTLSGKALLNADVDASGAVNNKDYVILVQFINGKITESLPIQPVEETVIYGDVNEDGLVNNHDLVLLTNHLMNNATLSEKALLNADVDESGAVNNKDLDILTKYLNNNLYQNILPYRPVTENIGLTYTITYDANGGTNAPASGTKNDGEGYQITDLEPQREHYTFIGWNTQKSGSDYSKYLSDDIYYGNEDLTLYAQWKADDVKVIYLGNGGTGGAVGTEEEVPYYVAFRLPEETPTKTDSTFLGWSLSENGDETLYQPGDYLRIEAFDDTPLYAIWEDDVAPDPVTVTVTFDPLGGTVDESTRTVNKDTPIGTLPVATKPNDEFLGWFLDMAFDYSIYDDIAISNTMTVYAKYKSDIFTLETVSDYDIYNDEYVLFNEKLKKNVIKSADEGYTLDYNANYKERNDITYIGTSDILKVFKTGNLSNFKQYTIIVLGDCNGDGIINSGDLYSIQSHLINKKALFTDFKIAADANKDNNINSGDLYKIQSYLIGKSTMD